MDLLCPVALEALEAGRAVDIFVAVSLADLALVPRRTATDAKVVQSRGVVAVVLAHRTASLSSHANPIAHASSDR